MISITIPSKRKSFQSTYYPSTNTPPTNLLPFTKVNEVEGSLWVETKRRQQIIKKLTHNLPYVVGSLVEPIEQSDKNKYGHEHIVTNICDEYYKYGKDEKWPKGDNPMLVEIKRTDTGDKYWCTVNFIKTK